MKTPPWWQRLEECENRGLVVAEWIPAVGDMSACIGIRPRGVIAPPRERNPRGDKAGAGERTHLTRKTRLGNGRRCRSSASTHRDSTGVSLGLTGITTSICLHRRPSGGLG